MRISITILARYPTTNMIVETTIQNPTTSLFRYHSGKQWASGQQQISSQQHLKSKSHQLLWLKRWRNSFILRVGRSIFSVKRRMNASLGHWYPRTYRISCLNDLIRLLLYIFTRGRIQMKSVSNWLHGELDMCGGISTVLMT